MARQENAPLAARGLRWRVRPLPVGTGADVQLQEHAMTASTALALVSLPAARLNR